MQGTAQHGNVRAAFCIGIGIGEEAAFGGNACTFELRHQRFIAQASAILLKKFFTGQRCTHLPPVPAFHQRQRAQAFLATCQLLQQLIRGQTRAQLVITGLDGAVFARKAKPCVQQARIGLHTGLDHALRHTTRGGAGLYLQLQIGLRQLQRLIQPPPCATRSSSGQQ